MLDGFAILPGESQAMAEMRVGRRRVCIELSARAKAASASSVRRSISAQ